MLKDLYWSENMQNQRIFEAYWPGGEHLVVDYKFDIRDRQTSSGIAALNAKPDIFLLRWWCLMMPRLSRK